MIRLKDQDVLPVCPERLGGLPTPRPACSIAGGDGAAVLAGTARVVDKNSADQTDAFIRGARRTLDLALKSNACQCYLKAKSPSCGSGKIAVQIPASDWPLGYRPVLGVTAALLLESGFDVVEIP